MTPKRKYQNGLLTFKTISMRKKSITNQKTALTRKGKEKGGMKWDNSGRKSGISRISQEKKSGISKQAKRMMDN
jgi:hypothetical protein